MCHSQSGGTWTAQFMKYTTTIVKWLGQWNLLVLSSWNCCCHWSAQPRGEQKVQNNNLKKMIRKDPSQKIVRNHNFQNLQKIVLRDFLQK